MLVLTRKTGEVVTVGDNVTVMVVEVRGDKVRLGFSAPKDVRINRMEVAEAMRLEEKRDEQNII